MNPLFIMALSNVVVAGVMAVLVFGISRVYRRPAVIHGLWMLVLLKLITPPVFTIPVNVPGWGTSSDASEVDSSPAAQHRKAVQPQNSNDNLLARADRAEANPTAGDLPYQPVRVTSGGFLQTASPMPTVEPQPEFLVDPGPPAMMKLPERALRSPQKEWNPGRNARIAMPPPRMPLDGQSGEITGVPKASTALAADSRAETLAIAAEPPRSRGWGLAVLPIAIAVWLIGAAVLLLWTTIRVTYFRHLLRHAEVASPDLQRETDDLAKTIGLSKSPEVRLLPGAVTPMLWAGCGRPLLLFPRELLGRTDAQSRAMLLMHELAHMRRGDHWVRFLELLAVCLYWWNPVVWLARREIHRTEEECCDALVVEHSADRGRGYANALLDTLDFLAESPPAATRGMLPVSGIGRVDFIKRRLTMILNGSIRGRMSKLGRLAVLISAVCVLPLLPVVGDGGQTASGESKDLEKADAATKAERSDKSSAKSAKAELSRPTVGKLEPIDFETTPRSLQFDPLEVRSVAISKDGRWFASGHGRWTTSGVVRVWDFKSKKEIHAFPETKGIATVVFSPDAKLLASAGWAGNLIIRDTRDFKVLHEIPLGGVARLAFSPDGKTLASASESSQLRLWDPKTGKEKPALKGTFFRMQTVAFSPDGKYIAVGGGKFENPQNGRVSAWNLKTGKQIKVIENLRRPVISVAFSADSKTIAAGGFDNMIHMYDSGDLALRRSLRGHTQFVEHVAFSPDGKTLASTSNDQTTRLWDPSTGDQLTALSGHSNTILCAAFTRDGKTLITGAMDKTLRVWDAKTYREIESLQPGSDSVEFPEPVLAVAYSPKGKWIASAHEDKTVRLRDAVTGSISNTLTGHDDVVSQIAFSPDGKTLATASYDKTVKLWNLADGKLIRTYPGHTNWVFAVAFSPDGKRLASSGYDKKIRVWNVANGKSVATLSGHFATVRAVAFSRDGKRLVSGSGDRTLKVWDLTTNKEVRTLKGHKGTVRAVAFSPDGDTIASAGEDNLVKLWDGNTGSEKSSLTGHSGMVWCIAFSPRGQSLASGGFDNSIIIWDPSSGRRRKTLRGHTDVVTSLAFDPDMKGLVSGSYDKTVRFWTAKQPPIGELLTISASPEDMRCVAFSNDGRYMAAAGHDRLAKVWELQTGRLIHVLRGHTGGIRSIAFSPNSKLVATGSWDDTIRVWNVATGKPEAEFRDADGKQNVVDVVFTRDGKQVVSGGLDKIVRLWDIDSRKLVWKSAAQGLEIGGVDVSPDGKTIVSATGHYKRKNDSGLITFWELKTGKKRFELPGPKDVKMVAYAPDGKRVLVGSGDSRTPFQLIDVKTRQRTNGPRGFRAAFLPDGKTIAACRGPGRQVFLYDLEANRELATFVGHPDTPGGKGTIFDLAASPDGSVFASLSTGGTMKLWPLRATPALRSRMTIPATVKDATRFALPTKDGKHIVTGSHKKTVKIWDRKTGRLIDTLTGHKGGITCGAISPNGKTLVTGSWDSTAHVWDLRTRKATGMVLKHTAEVVEIAYSPDGKYIVASGRDKRISLWDAKTGKLVRSTEPQAKAIATFGISPDGRQLAGVVSDWKTPRESAAVKLWTLPELKDQGVVYRHRYEMKCAKFSSDGKKLVVAGTDMLTVLDVKTRKTLATMPTTTGIMDAHFAEDDRLVVTGDWLGRVTIWNATTGKQLAAGRDHNRFIFRISLDPKTNTIFSAGMDGTVKTWPMLAKSDSLLARIRRWRTPRTVPQASSTGTRLLVQNSADRVFFGVTSPDFKRFAVGRNNGTVTLYTAPSFKVEKELKGHTGNVLTGAFSHGGLLLATAGDDKSIRLLNVKSGEEMVMKGHEKRINSLVFSRDDKQVISCDGLGYIKAWDVKSALCIGTFRKKEAALTKLAISPDGKLLAAGGWAKEIDLWSLPDRKLLGTLTGHTKRILSLTFSPDGRSLVSGDAGRDPAEVIKIWDVVTRTLRVSFDVKTNHVLAAAFSPDGRTFVTSGGDTNLRFWDTATGQSLATVPSGHRLDVRGVEWSPDGTQLLTTSLSGTAKRWSLSSGKLWMPGYTTVSEQSVKLRLARSLANHTNAWCATFSPDGKQLATGGTDKTAIVWNTDTWKEAFRVTDYDGAVYSMKYSPNGKLLAVAGQRAEIQIRSASDGALLKTLRGHRSGVRCIAFSRDGKRLVSASWDKTARIWDVQAGRLLHTCEQELAVYTVAVSPNGKLLATGGGDWKAKKNDIVTLWNLETGKRVKQLPAVTGVIHSLAFLTNTKLATSRAGGVGLATWDITTGKQLAVLNRLQGTHNIHVSADGKSIVVGHGNNSSGSFSAWNAMTNQLLARFKVAEMYIVHAEQSPDGRYYATASRNGNVKVWQLVNKDGEVIAANPKTVKPDSKQ